MLASAVTKPSESTRCNISVSRVTLPTRDEGVSASMTISSMTRLSIGMSGRFLAQSILDLQIITVVRHSLLSGAVGESLADAERSDIGPDLVYVLRAFGFRAGDTHALPAFRNVF